MEIVSVLSNAIALFMLWLFASAGINKLLPANRLYYQAVLNDYGFTLPELATTLVWLLGAIELLSGLLMLFPVTRSLGLIGCGALLGIYMLAISKQLWQGKLDMDCGCAGPAGSVKVSPALLLRNTVFVCLLLICVTDPVLVKDATLNINHWFLAMPMAAILILINQSSEQLLANAQKLKLLKAVM